MSLRYQEKIRLIFLCRAPNSLSNLIGSWQGDASATSVLYGNSEGSQLSLEGASVSGETEASAMRQSGSRDNKIRPRFLSLA